MKRTIRTAALLLALALTLGGAAMAGESDDIISAKYVEITGDDFVVDTLDGVPAYPYNQCNDLAVRYYAEVLGVDMFVGVFSPILMDNYFTVFFSDIEDWGDIPDELSGFQHTDTPKKGDIVYWSMARRGKDYAHTALVKDYSDGVITLIEQNWNWQGKAVYERKIRFPSENYVVYTLPEQPPKPTPVAFASPTTIYVDGEATAFEAYALRDEAGNDTNYLKLRDVAAALDGSAAQFNVDWQSGSILLAKRSPYTTRNGSELQKVFDGDQPYAASESAILIDGASAELDAITLTDANGGQHTYFKLRDLGANLGFDVSWDDATGTILIDTTREYDPSR